MALPWNAWWPWTNRSDDCGNLWGYHADGYETYETNDSRGDFFGVFPRIPSYHASSGGHSWEKAMLKALLMLGQRNMQQPIFSTEPLLPAPVHGDPTHWKEGDGDVWHPADYQIFGSENM